MCRERPQTECFLSNHFLKQLGSKWGNKDLLRTVLGALEWAWYSWSMSLISAVSLHLAQGHESRTEKEKEKIWSWSPVRVSDDQCSQRSRKTAAQEKNLSYQPQLLSLGSNILFFHHIKCWFSCTLSDMFNVTLLPLFPGLTGVIGTKGLQVNVFLGFYSSLPFSTSKPISPTDRDIK